MEPGLGYMIYNTDEPKSFAYPSATVAMAPRKDKSQIINHKSQTTSVFTPVDYHQFDGNMTLIAQLVKDGQPLANTELGIFANEECRTATVSDENGLLITLIPGNEETTTLSFKVVVDDQILVANETTDYSTNTTIGSLDMPFVITIGDTFTGNGTIQSDNVQCIKFLRDNQLIILRGDKVYTITGQERR